MKPKLWQVSQCRAAISAALTQPETAAVMTASAADAASERQGRDPHKGFMTTSRLKPRDPKSLPTARALSLKRRRQRRRASANSGARAIALLGCGTLSVATMRWATASKAS